MGDNTSFRVMLMSKVGKCLFHLYACLLRNETFNDDIIRQEAVQYVVKNWNRFLFLS